MSLENEVEEQEIEVRSVMEASSHEAHSSCFEEADCSQSDISLCDDGASEGAGNLLG